MKDQPSISDDDDEEPVRWSRPVPSMDEYLEYNPETDSYYALGTLSAPDADAWRRELTEIAEEFGEDERGGGLITRDELLAAGALDCPPEMRKSLGAHVKRDGQRDLFSDLTDGDETHSENQERTSSAPEASAEDRE